MEKKPAQAKKNNNVRWLIPVITTIVFVVLLTVTFLLKKDNSAPEVTIANPAATKPANQISLPTPALKSSISVESTLKTRRTKRTFLDEKMDLKVASQLLWAAQGVTSEWGGRTTPSAKSTYPLSVYLVANKIDGLNSGLYLYVPGDRTPVHALKPIAEGDFGKAFFASLNQNSFKNAPGILVITGDMTKMANAFGGIPHDKEVYLEAGHAAQNLYLQAETLKIGVVSNSSFDDSIIRNIITIPDTETIIYLIPFGLPKD